MMTLLEAFTERPNAEAWAYALHHAGVFLFAAAGWLFILCVGWWWEHIEHYRDDDGFGRSRSGARVPLWLKALVVFVALTGASAVIAADFICLGRCSFYDRCHSEGRRR